jgi:hypothetical protein
MQQPQLSQKQCISPAKETIRRNENFWKIRMQRQISNWRKEISILAETGTGSDNGKLNRKEEEDFSKT